MRRGESKRKFWIIASLSFGLCVGVLAALLDFSPTGSTALDKEKSANALTDDASLGDGKDQADIEEASEPNSVWSRMKLLKTPPTRVKNELTQEAAIQNNLENLLALYDSRQDQEFVERLRALIEQFPQVPEYRALLGDYHYNEGNWKQAESAVRNLLEIDPQNNFAKVTLGELTAIQGKFTESEEILRNVIENDVSQPEALYGFVSLMEMQGRDQEGFQKILDIYNRNSEDGNIAVVLADLHYARRELQQRQSVLEKAIVTDPQNPEPYRALATDAVRQADYDRAYTLARKAFRYDSNPATRIRSLDLMFQASLGRGDFKEAERSLERIIEINPNDFAARQQIQQVRQMAENASP